MKLKNYEVNLPSYSIGEDIYKEIPEKCEPYGSKVLVIGGEKALEAAKEKIFCAVKESSLTIIDSILYGADCTYENVERLAKLACYQEADMIFAVGGGKALDTCKCLCTEHEKPFFTFPTIASNCAVVTTVSIMYQEDGTFLKPHFFLKPAVHAFLDTGIMAQAPAKYMWAGVGDTYAKYYEAEISSRDEVLEHFTSLGVSLSRQCLEPILRYGMKAYADNQKKVSTYELEQIVLAIVVTTGIVSIFLTRDFTPDYNSGLAHGVFYALTRYPVIEKKHLHGEVVGFGVLIALLVDGNQKEYERIRAFNEAIGLPVKLSDIEISRDEFDTLLDVIPQMSDVKHYPYRVTAEMLKKAIDDLESVTVHTVGVQ